MFTYVLIALAAILVVAIVVHEVRSWRRPGKQIGQNAAMDSGAVNQGRFTSRANNNDTNAFGGPGGI